MDDFDLDLDEAVETSNLYRKVLHDDKQICSCGHGISRHKFDKYQNRYICQPSAYICPCMVMKPVIEVSNTRYFMRKSQGSGVKHALSMGYAASKEAIGDVFTDGVTWLIEPKCEICGAETKYYPSRVTASGKILLDVDPDEGITAFLCAECRNPVKHGK
jgi:hypothetical protein